MEPIPSPRELRSAARACTALAYMVGLVGIGAGSLLVRDGAVLNAAVVWTSTFALGAVLVGLALVLRALTAVLAHLLQLRERTAAPPSAVEDSGPVWPQRS